MNCKFSPESCSINCSKYYMCMYSSIQQQLSEIQQQLNFILTTLTQISCETVVNKEHLNTVDNNISNIVSTLIELTNDSETNYFKKESEHHDYEKIN